MIDPWREPAANWNRRYQSPLAPGAEDLAFISDWMRRLTAEQQGLRPLIFGVTSQYLDLPWPADTSLLAVDHSPSMIEHAWLGSPSQVLCADWFDLPLPDASSNFLLCDCGLCLQPWPGTQAALIEVLKRVIEPGGLLIMRCFVLPEVRESLADILAALRAGEIPNFSALQLRLWLALQTDRQRGVTSRDVRDALRAEADMPELFASLPGATPGWLDAVDPPGQERRFWFTDIGEIRDWFTREPGGFSLEACYQPAYTLGAVCPVLVLRRR